MTALTYLSAWNRSADKGERPFRHTEGIVSQRKTEKIFDAGKEANLEEHYVYVHVSLLESTRNNNKDR
jgi:hypothetical protein